MRDKPELKTRKSTVGRKRLTSPQICLKFLVVKPSFRRTISIGPEPLEQKDATQHEYLGNYFVPDLSVTEDIKERISQARKLFGSMRKQLLCTSNKQIPIDIRRKLYQATVVNIALGEADRSKLEAFDHGCLRKMCGWTIVGCSRETDQERTG
jgi:hypothetical protein